jgi:hypothetical protein
MIPISKNVIQPKIKTNVNYVDSLEDFESIKLDINETILRFDNNQPCFYVRERDKFGNYSSVKIYFYESVSDRVQNIAKSEFIQKCKQAGLNEVKTQIACLFFLENKTPEQVWEWALTNKINYEWDTLKSLKYRIKKKLFPELVKKVDKK